MEDFKEYVNHSVKNRCWMEKDIQAGIELMDLLHKNGLLSLYDPIMEWHMKYPNTQKRRTKDQLTETLRKRYSMEDCKPELVRVNLPSAGIQVRIPCHDAQSMMQDLLTDPRIVDGDYLWFNDNPCGAPPAEWMEVADINDGLAYRKTYEQEILHRPYTESGRRRVLLPVMCYMHLIGQFRIPD